MANYFTLEYESTANTSPSNVELNYGSPTSGGLTVHVSLYAGSGFTATHYKMWGLELVEGEGVVTVSGAEWIAFTDERTARLARHNNPQSAYVKFKNASETETETFQSNEVTFTFVDPIIRGDLAWESDFEELGFESASANAVKKTSAKTKVEFNKNKLTQLEFSGRDFRGLTIGSTAIYINPSSEVGQIIALDSNSYVTIEKEFDSDDVPMITVDYGDGFTTLTAYDQEIKTTVSGNNAGRVDNVSWNSETKTLSFDAYRFSTYGFATIQKVEFTNDSRTAVYTGNTATFYVYVQDTNGEPVESAPVTLSGVSGNIGTLQETPPVNTDSNGRAEFNLDVSSAGTMRFTASVDSHTVAEDFYVTGIAPVNAQRSLLTQYEQIRRSGVYSDTVSGVNTQAVAEPSTPTVSGLSDSVLEHDMNVFRTLIKQLKGTDFWFTDMPTYEDPTDTTTVKDASLHNLSENTLDAHTIILAVAENLSGTGYSLTPGDEGFLFYTGLDYATPANKVGLPIFKSTTNSGTYYDEGGLDRVVGIDVIDMDTGGEFRAANGDIVFAKFHDGADAPTGSGVGTDVYVKFYTDEGEYTTTSGDPSTVMMVFPYRKVLSDMAEHEWHRTDFISSWEGDEIITSDIKNLWSYTGSSDNESTPNWTPISGFPVVASGTTTSLRDALDAINSSIGSRTFADPTYITSGDPIADILDDLDTSMYALSQTVAGGAEKKYIVTVDQDYAAGESYTLPVGVSYTPSSAGNQQGKNLDVYLDGQLLSASTGPLGVNEDKDYAETSPTTIEFHFDIYQYSNLMFKVRT
jgi:hypothetical protein